mmetsp:Transcript_3669/g.6564  ORF Transcript_3669/g.6564 Transcript_3669/m.6564 type:complete len:271 (-) Transcript_3669:156-968(-)
MFMHRMMWDSYIKFRHLEDSDSEEDVGDGPCTEEGMMKAFVTLHARRVDLDANLVSYQLDEKMFGPKHVLSDREFASLDALMHQYDDICKHVLAVDGVSGEGLIRSIGHRLEVTHCRLASGRIAYNIARYDLAATRASQAIVACEVDDDAGIQQHGAVEDLRRRLIDSLFLRSASFLRQGNYKAARTDARLLHSQTKSYKHEEAMHLMIRCEMALRAGGPGSDGRGCSMDPEEVCTFELGSEEVPVAVCSTSDRGDSVREGTSNDFFAMD